MSTSFSSQTKWKHGKKINSKYTSVVLWIQVKINVLNFFFVVVFLLYQVFIWTPSSLETNMRNLRKKNRKRGFYKLKCCVCRAAEGFQLNWDIVFILQWLMGGKVWIWVLFGQLFINWKQIYEFISKAYSLWELRKRYILNGWGLLLTRLLRV